MRRRKTLIVLGVVLMLLTGGGFGYRGYQRSPSFSLNAMQDAIAAKNRLRFETYVDAESLASAVVTEIAAKSTLEAVREGSTGFAILGGLLTAQAAEGLKAALAHEMKAALLRGVETGRLDSLFASTKPDTAKKGERKLDLMLLATSTASDQMRFAGLGDVAREGSVATVALRFRNELLDTTLVLRLRMDQQADGRWKITRPDNLTDYLNEIERLQQAHLAAQNLAVRQRIERTVRIGPLTRSVRSAWYDEYVFLRSRIENIGTETVDSMMFMVYRDGEPVHRRNGALVLIRRLAPGESGTAEGAFDYNRFISEHTTLRYGEGLEIQPWIMVFHRNGKTEQVGEYLSWSDYLSRRPT